MKLPSIVVAMTLTISCASTPIASPDLDREGKLFSPVPWKARVYIARPGASGAAVLVSVIVDGRTAGALPPESYLVIDLEPGAHIFVAAVDERQLAVPLETRAGELYFLRLRAGNRFRIDTEEQGKAAVRAAKRVVSYLH